MLNYGNRITIASVYGFETVQVNIYDIQGRIIKSISTEIGSSITMDFPKNVFLVEVVGKKGRFVQKAFVGQ